MPDSSLPQIPPQELAERLDRGESLQVLDVRAPEKVERGHVTIDPSWRFMHTRARRSSRFPTSARYISTRPSHRRHLRTRQLE